MLSTDKYLIFAQLHETLRRSSSRRSFLRKLHETFRSSSICGAVMSLVAMPEIESEDKVVR
jgi:hypothetical protein